VGWHELDLSGSEQTPVARSCKYSSEHSGTMTSCTTISFPRGTLLHAVSNISFLDTLQVSTSGSVLHIVMNLRMNMATFFKPFYANANHYSGNHSHNTHMKSKTSTATNVTANFQNNNIKKSKNSATNLFHRGGILYSIPK